LDWPISSTGHPANHNNTAECKTADLNPKP